MDTVTTENPYPVQGIWLLKNILGTLIYLTVIIIVVTLINFFKGTNLSLGSMYGSLIVGLYLSIFLIGALFQIIIPLVVNSLKRSHFRYSLGQQFMTIHQGVIKKQQRNVPYGVIQGVFFRQDLYDRILGLASITIEDFSQGGKSVANADGDMWVGSGKSRRKVEMIGFTGNKIHIPGLLKEDAEALRVMILQKMKENPIEDSNSGL